MPDPLEAGAIVGAEQGDRTDLPVAGDPLVALLVTVVEHHGYECRVISDDEVEISRAGRGGPLHMWLTNLRQWVGREPQEEWAAIVSDFVGSLIATTEVDEEDVLDLADYGLIRPLLRTRLYADDFQAGPGEIVRRPVAPGLIEILVIDRPTSLMLVRADMASAWPVSTDEAFRAAHDNVRRDGPLEIESELFDGVRLSTLHGETAYVTAHAVWVGDYPVTGPEGVLVTVPVQGVIHAVPIRGMDVLNAMDLLIKIAWSGYREGPRSVSPNVYWWQEDTPLLLAGAVEPGEDSLSVRITPEFQDLLERLAQD
ncbi:hypothetical protein [Actinomadura rudentiformis]|uniref:Uncharacterized protein n=1 Tax=Actinomadura rudentiformis TaxID=359158 RepID=A0A6H9YW97_9ACTN|nr:hypothetical protein [Actinomadura rudentiformis]KAB2344336.1 hypothetical protein F8566_30800 [Actinomadura rudentiformis]